jgi:hypothetical protein
MAQLPYRTRLTWFCWRVGSVGELVLLASWFCWRVGLRSLVRHPHDWNKRTVVANSFPFRFDQRMRHIYSGNSSRPSHVTGTSPPRQQSLT